LSAKLLLKLLSFYHVHAGKHWVYTGLAGVALCYVFTLKT